MSPRKGHVHAEQDVSHSLLPNENNIDASLDFIAPRIEKWGARANLGRVAALQAVHQQRGADPFVCLSPCSSRPGRPPKRCSGAGIQESPRLLHPGLPGLLSPNLLSHTGNATILLHLPSLCHIRISNSSAFCSHFELLPTRTRIQSWCWNIRKIPFNGQILSETSESSMTWEMMIRNVSLFVIKLFVCETGVSSFLQLKLYFFFYPLSHHFYIC